MLIDLADAVPMTSGGKAAPLARLLTVGLPVPSGFVVPTRAYEQAVAEVDLLGAVCRGSGTARTLIEHLPMPPALIEEIAGALARFTGPPSERYVAVRSSATSEDGADATAAGQHDTVLGARGPDQVATAVRTCWASLWSERAVQYRQRQPRDRHTDPPTTAVLVQQLIDADVAGVLFTETSTRIEASWGLGSSVVAGQVTPDSWTITDGAILRRAIGAKTTRTDRVGTQVLTRDVPPTDRNRLCLTDHQVLHLTGVGRRIEHLLGRPQDVEWAIADGRLWILQARPITATLTTTSSTSTRPALLADLAGTPASPGLACGLARVIRSPSDFARVRPGDVLICRTTDPAWTPLFGVVAAVITETGGLLSHAAIVAREQRLPAVLAVPHATAAIPEGTLLEVDGNTGKVRLIAEHHDQTAPTSTPPPS